MVQSENSSMRIGSLALLAMASALIPLTGLLMVMGDEGLMWLMAVAFFVGLFALVGGALLADRAARE